MRAKQVLDLATTRRLARNGEARAIRLDSHLSIADVAAPIGVSVATLSRWENGSRRPTGHAALLYGELLRELARQASDAETQIGDTDEAQD